MDRSRLIFVEGIMGSGKSTTARWLARLFRRTGIPAQPVPEARPHPTNVFRSLPHWKQLYQDYRQLTDMCLETLPIPKLAIETSSGAWSSDQTRIRTFLDLPFLPEPAWQRWFYKLYDYLVDIR